MSILACHISVELSKSNMSDTVGAKKNGNVSFDMAQSLSQEKLTLHNCGQK